MSDMVADKAHR